LFHRLSPVDLPLVHRVTLVGNRNIHPVPTIPIVAFVSTYQEYRLSFLVEGEKHPDFRTAS
jgi:hypothetical protein